MNAFLQELIYWLPQVCNDQAYLESHLEDYLIQSHSVDENMVLGPPESRRLSAFQIWGSTQILDALTVIDEQ